jgi:hypothetical protein
VRRGARTVHGKDKGRGEDGVTVMGHPLFIPVQRRRQRRRLGHEGEPCGGKEDEGGGAGAAVGRWQLVGRDPRAAVAGGRRLRRVIRACVRSNSGGQGR